MRKLLTVAAAVVFGGFAIVARLGMTPPGAIAAATCSGDRSPAGADTTLVRIGASIAAVDDGALAILQGDQETRVAPADQLGGAIRHVSSTPGVGTTYVRDRAGADVVVTTTSAGLRRFPAHGEALHPSLGSDGSLVWAQGAGLRLVGPGSDRVHPIAGPMRDGIAFSPRFDTD